MSAGTREDDATVHLRLRGAVGEDELTELRQQLAACLRSGVRDLRVHVDGQRDLDVAVLQALNGVSKHLASRGGAVTVHGASPRVLTKMAIHGMGHLLATPPVAGTRTIDLTEAPSSTTPADRERVP